MARNQEKNQSFLNRFYAAKIAAERGPGRGPRPSIASEVSDLKDAQFWLRTIIGDLAKNISTIQNGGLGEHKIRDLNDRINQLLREKRAWERQVEALGGPKAPQVSSSSASCSNSHLIRRHL